MAKDPAILRSTPSRDKTRGARPGTKSGEPGRPGNGAEISLVALTKTYSGEHTITALNDVSVRISAGEFVTFLGPSGAGKTSILRIVAGLEDPDHGQVLLDQRDVTHLPPQRREMGVVFQDYALFPHMTVRQNCAFPLEVRRRAAKSIRSTVDAVLETVQLTDYAERYPAQLSGGQKQRVAIARTLVYQPGVLLMDEPLGALDKNLREHMQLELRQLQQRLGVTCVYVTHDQDEAMALSDRVAVMRSGGIEQIGTPKELYREPQSEFVAGFFGKMNFLRGTITKVGHQDLTVDTAFGDVVAARELTRLRDESMRAGTPVTVAIRPEHVSVGEAIGRTDGAADGIGGNTFTLTAHRVRYAGSSTYVDGGGVDGAGLVTACLSSDPAGLSVGDRVPFHFPAAQTFVFEPASADASVPNAVTNDEVGIELHTRIGERP